MQMFHVNKISVHPEGIATITERLIDNLSGRNIPPFRVDHFGNFTDGIFVIVSEYEDPLNMQKYRTEVEDAVVDVRNEFRLEHFSGHWIS